MSELYENSQDHTYDKTMLCILLAHLPIVAFIVPIGYDTSSFAIIACVLNGIFIAATYQITKNTRVFRIFASMALMIFSAVMIQAQMGRLEMHFHIFSALALTLIYRDWIAPVSAAVTIAIHHLIVTQLQLSGVMMGNLPVVIYSVECSWSITLIHAAFVVLETAGLAYFAVIMSKEKATDEAIRSLIIEMVSNKDLTARLSGDSHTEQLANHLSENFCELIAFLNDGNRQLLATSQNMLSISQKNTDSLDKQRCYVDRVASASNEMASSAGEVASHASDALNTANDISTASDKCTALTSNTVALVSNLNEGLLGMASSIDELKKDTVNISSVLDVIRSVSEQTNLLALNAAIEAARAGEQGRGFAVVADEVRMLAQRTQNSTNEIQEMMNSLLSSTDKVVASMNSGREMVQESKESIGESESALAIIAGNVEKLVEINNLVANASRDQSNVSEEVSKDITLIAEAVSLLEQPNAELADNAAELSSTSEHLGGKISGYRVTI